jgi:hypothetical protein
LGDLISHIIQFELFDSLTHLIPHIPAAFRPLTPSLRSHILRIIISTETPHDLKITAADVIARLHLTSGKAQAGGAWSSEMRECIAGFGMGLGGVIADGWEEGEGHDLGEKALTRYRCNGCQDA